MLAQAPELSIITFEITCSIVEHAARSTIELPGCQSVLLQAVLRTGAPTVLLVMSGRSLRLHCAVEHVPTIVQIWERLDPFDC